VRQSRLDIWLVGGIAVGLFAPREARADSKAVAEALFRDGSQLLVENHVDEACAKLAESQKIDPALGTLLYLASCHEKQGHTASAWSEFSSAKQWAKRLMQTERMAFAEQHIASLERRLSAIVITPPAIPGLELRVDDGLLSAAVGGTPLPLDPGEHTVEATAPGYVPWRTVVQVPSAPGTIAVDVPELAPVADSNETTKPEPVAADAPPASTPGGAPALKALTWSAIGLAGAGVAAGSLFGALAWSARDSAASACPGNRCSPAGLDDIDHAKTYATVSTIAFGAGVVGAVAGGVLLLGGIGGGSSSGHPNALPSAMIVPHVSPGEGGALLFTRF
jgi:hypothetical protein